jgi:hypothetical protein
MTSLSPIAVTRELVGPELGAEEAQLRARCVLSRLRGHPHELGMRLPLVRPSARCQATDQWLRAVFRRQLHSGARVLLSAIRGDRVVERFIEVVLAICHV